MITEARRARACRVTLEEKGVAHPPASLLHVRGVKLKKVATKLLYNIPIYVCTIYIITKVTELITLPSEVNESLISCRAKFCYLMTMCIIIREIYVEYKNFSMNQVLRKKLVRKIPNVSRICL